jgi:hypothetical protein
LRNHVFFVDGKQVLFRKGGQGLISLLLGASFTMVIVGGIVLSSFTFRIDGLAGFAVDFARTDQAEAKLNLEHFSVWSGAMYLASQADDLETPATVAGIWSIVTTYLVRRSPVTLDYLLANRVHFHAGVCFVGATGPSHLFTGIVDLLTYSAQPETTISSERIASGMVGFTYFRSRHHCNTV